MKTNILSFLSVLSIVLFGFTSCNTDAEGVIYGGNRNTASFASTQMNNEVTAQDNGIVKVPVYRGEKTGELTVDLTLSNNANILTLTTPTVTFRNGETVAYAEISFGNINNLGATDKYQATVSISDPAKVSVSGVKEIKISVQRKLTWETYGIGKYESELFEDSWDQPIEKAKEGNIYRLPDCFYAGYPLIFVLSDDNQTLLSWAAQPMGYKHATYGMVYFQAKSMVRNGNTLEFDMLGRVIYNGKLATLWSGFTERLTMPNK
ncbi:hypothetical protein [Acetobacteroides hydrogenigenes]|uniref:DUF4843 domain-containing protein n=1 Tax=Acetobacteroides hydrogenigenes TaxID=979970 RepID=A0A4R2ENE2_9BACT|nr:hypothetical protein [Acetobacteroides hydrogenigenes]TCN70251.1 hypothetical protein CLV25_104210 [Acetobacteroides hydrogenigenes]